MIQRKIVDTIEQYDSIIIHHHVNPDPDCIGSQLGLKYLIQASYPNKKVYAVGNFSEGTAFLGDMDMVSDDVYHSALVIIVDVGDKHRIDDNRFLSGKELIKIDHHPLTEKFADIDWVDSTFAAATEMIIDIYMNNKDRLVMTENAARVLYAGLLTDTGRFYYSNVSERTLIYGAEVYKYNFDKQALYADIYYKTIDELKFKGYTLNHFSYTKNGLGFMKLNDELLQTFKITPDYASAEVNILANIKDIYTWIFFIEYKETGKIRVEFRSRGPVVNQLAKKYGGGGHTWASGALVDSWESVDFIIKDADELCFAYTNKSE